MEGIEGDYFSILVENRQGVAANQQELRMRDRIFAPIRSAQRKWPEPSIESLANPVNVHVGSLILEFCQVKNARGTYADV